ncbi:MAG TPA: formylmethanofuran dehydrogenase subunit C, partial [Gemmatimonadales bacterium]|nr:formylmethanofuran dehydrogenase subunit C [Gemmatimonadales bacterium]
KCHLRTMRPVVLLLWMVVLPGVRAQTAVVLHHWSGGLLAREIRVNALLSDPCDSVRLVVDDDPGFSSPVYSAYMPADTAHGLVAHLHRGGLQPSTHYHYRFEVAGRVGAFAASGMKGGEIHIAGDAGDFLGGAIPGDHQGMSGGLVLVTGNAGARAGDRMRRGVMLINGGAGDYLASRMVAGTIAVAGAVGRGAGTGMRRGTLLLPALPAALPPTFNDCGVFPFTMLTMLARAWRGLPGPFGSLPDGGFRVRRLMGDLANDGRGEILIRA